MAIAELLLPEFDHESATTRLLLERAPEAQVEFKPHDKSMTLGQLALHIATLTRWAQITLTQTSFDMKPLDGSAPERPVFESLSRTLAVYDEGVREARELLGSTSDAAFMVQWTLKSEGKPLFSMPRAAVFRTFVLNHAVHHRGQLSVYLRMCGVPLPNIYGPTADTM